MTLMNKLTQNRQKSSVTCIESKCHGGIRVRASVAQFFFSGREVPAVRSRSLS